MSMAERQGTPDDLDVLLLRTLRDNPRAGFLELSRLTGVSRATVQARLQRLEDAGVVTGYGPDIDVVAAGFPVRAFVIVEIDQGRLQELREGLDAIPAVIEAYATTGAADVHCRVAATSHEDLQATLLALSRVPGVVRSTSVIVLSEVISPRTLPLLESQPRARPSRVPTYRSTPAHLVPEGR
jgi:DNA-binding Lrp family transcriptional regulator